MRTGGRSVDVQIGRYTQSLIGGTMIGSAVMNAFAFTASATGWQVYAAAAFGIAIPGMIYALMKIAAAVYIDSNNRG